MGSPYTDAAILHALQGLTNVVGALSDKVALLEADRESAPATQEAFVPYAISNESTYSALVPPNAENELRRFKLAQALGLLGTPGGDALIATGARGFYRQFVLPDGQMAHEAIPRDLCRALVTDAQGEDAREAIDMASNLLPVLPDGGPETGVSIPVLND